MRTKKNGTFIDDDLLNDPDILTPEHLGFAVMCECRRDIIGVVPASVRTAAPICRLSHRQFRSTVDYFEGIGRVQKAVNWHKNNGGMLWWISGLWYGLKKGHPTEKQKTACVDCILKWHESKLFDKRSEEFGKRSNLFGDRSEEFGKRSKEFDNKSATFPSNFLKLASQLVVNQHRVDFPPPLLYKLNLNDINLTETERGNAVTTINPNIRESTDPIKDFDGWAKTEKAKKRIDTLTVSYGMSKERVNAEFEKARAWVIASPKQAARSVTDNHDGDWGSFFGRWLIRARNDHHRKGANV